MFKVGDKIICMLEGPDYGTTYEIKYLLASSVVVNEDGMDFPIRFKYCIPYSTLLKELL